MLCHYIVIRICHYWPIWLSPHIWHRYPKWRHDWKADQFPKPCILGTRWAPTRYKWGYNPTIIGVITPVIEDRCPPCMISILNFRGACVITMPFPPVFLRLKGPGSLICACVFWWHWGGLGRYLKIKGVLFFGGNSSWKTKPKVRKTTKISSSLK